VDTQLLPLPAWDLLTKRLPNANLRQWILHACVFGVDLGFIGDRVGWKEADNPPATWEYAAAVDLEFVKEVRAGRRLGPYAEPPFEWGRVSPLIIVPKKQSTEPRICLNLSWPRGESVNDSVRDHELHLMSFAQATDLVAAAGRGSFLYKADVKSAFKCVRVRTADWPLLVMRWRRMYYVELVLPFGLKSSPALWDAFASTLFWYLTAVLALHLVYYVDDVFGVASSESGANSDLDSVIAVCQFAGCATNAEKTVRATQRAIFLGIGLDTRSMTVFLDDSRLAAIARMCNEWLEKTHARRKELQSLAGVLAFAAKALPCTRPFFGHILQAVARANDRVSSPIPDLLDFREDIAWWSFLARSWNGRHPILTSMPHAQASINISTDASRTGWAAVWEQEVLSDVWDRETLDGTDEDTPMPLCEAFAVGVALLSWAHRFSGKTVVVACDCLPVVQAFASGRSSSIAISRVIKAVAIASFSNGFNFSVVHIAGVNNSIADSLSRQQAPLNVTLVPSASVRRTPSWRPS
jgi:hypothetical protein